jgi:hypothetical protein
MATKRKTLTNLLVKNQVKIGPAKGVIDFPYMYIVKTKKFFLLKSERSRA